MKKELIELYFLRLLSLISAALIIVCFLLFGCNKKLLKEVSDEELVNRITSSVDFKTACTLLLEIKELTASSISDSSINYKDVLNEFKITKTSLTELELSEILNAMGYNHPTEISRKTFKFNSVIINLYNNIPIFKSLDNYKVQNVFKLAYSSTKKRIQTEPFKRDICSDNYGDGMDECDVSFGYGLFGVVIGGFSTLVSGNPLGAAATISLGGGAFYAQYGSCRQSVVRSWTRCRYLYPIK